VLFWILFGGLALMRRETFPRQLTAETVGLSLIWLGVALLFGYANPIVQFVVTYLVVMRSRILLDLANALARRGRVVPGLRVIDFAERLGADHQTRFIASVNRGVIMIGARRLGEAVEILDRALAEKPSGLHPKFEAACRYNLGVAHERAGRQKEALAEYRRVVTLAPGSLHAHGARAAIKRAMGGGKRSGG
jgi:tetratricopeptide (TPR) repeat protein